MISSFGCHSIKHQPVLSLGCGGGANVYLIATIPSVQSPHLTCDAIASFPLLTLFPGASLRFPRCFFSVPFSATLVTSIGGTDSVSIRASAHLRSRESDCLPPPSSPNHHLRIWQSDYLPLRHRLREHQHLFDGIHCHCHRIIFWLMRRPLLPPNTISTKQHQSTIFGLCIGRVEDVIWSNSWGHEASNAIQCNMGWVKISKSWSWMGVAHNSYNSSLCT